MLTTLLHVLMVMLSSFHWSFNVSVCVCVCVGGGGGGGPSSLCTFALAKYPYGGQYFTVGGCLEDTPNTVLTEN